MSVAPTPQFADLYEQYTIARGGKVDRERGIVYGVKLLGRYSQNSHDISGAESTEYTLEAMRDAVPLYEGAACYRGHGDRDEKDRDPAEKIGVIRQARPDGDCIRGDLHLFNPKAEFSTTLLEAAVNSPDGFAMSHNASGKWELRGNVAVITAVRRVRSVDVVGEGGTNASLFESHRPKKGKTMTFKESLLALLPKQSTRIVRLMEAAGDMGGMPMPEAEAAPAEDEATADVHLGNAVMAIYKDAEMTPEEKKRKILAILKLSDEPVSGTPPDEEGEEPLEESAEECDGDGKPKYPKAMKESLQRKLKRADLRDQVRDLCESKKLPADKATVDDLTSLGSLESATRWIDRLQLQADPMRRLPRSKQRGTVDVTESAEDALPTADELVSALPT